MFFAGQERSAVNFALVALVAIFALSIASCAEQFEQSSSTTLQTTEDNLAEQSPDDDTPPASGLAPKASLDRPADDGYSRSRDQMVNEQLAARDIIDRRVLKAMREVPRHEFVPPGIQRHAYDDSPLPIGHGQTISQPYIVALMTQLVEPQANKKALDIGTGSGYQAAVLAELVKHVYSIEIVEPLAKEARTRLQRLGYQNITARHGDGYRGWPSEAPFEIIIVAAAPDHVPKPLIDQLAPGGKMVIPVGDRYQKLILIEKNQDGTVVEKNVAPVAFVPMTGEAVK